MSDKEQLEAQEDGAKRPERRTIDKLHLVNFTAFKDLTMEFSPGINAIIGENATGKTHVLKVLYAATHARDDSDQLNSLSNTFCRKAAAVFQPKGTNNYRLIHKHIKGSAAAVHVDGSDSMNAKFTILPGSMDTDFSHPTEGYWGRWDSSGFHSCFIPANEFLSHAKHFAATYEEKYLYFDETYYDIAKAVYRPLNRKHDERVKQILGITRDAIGTAVVFEDADIYIPHKSTKVEIAMAPLGHCKFALLQILLGNGSIRPGSLLFWDEPEANLNPKLVGEVVEIILMLQRMGVQVFLATHDYVMLKELDLRAKQSDNVAYQALYRNPDDRDDIKCFTTNKFLELEPNSILDTYTSLYDRHVSRALENNSDET